MFIMTRRSLLLLVAIVALFYFSIIIFMLSPLYGSKGIYYGGIYMGSRQAHCVNWCKELHWRSPPLPYAVALVSYPGSGNTWLRYLLQQVTGIVTGSIYMDYGLKAHGFPAENVTDGSVLVVKTHEPPPVEPEKFKRAILLIRNPRDAILADFNRLHKGHIGTAPKSAFKKKSHNQNKTDWYSYVTCQLKSWVNLNNLWLTQFRGPTYVVYYESLVNETENTLRGILNFLNFAITEDEMNCALLHKEGIYRRKKKYQDFDPFTREMYKSLDEVKRQVYTKIENYRKHNDTAIITY